LLVTIVSNKLQITRHHHSRYGGGFLKQELNNYLQN